MNVFFSHITALRFWCNVETSIDGETSPCRFTRPFESTGYLSQIKLLDVTRVTGLGHTLHVLVDDRAKRGHAPRVVCHFVSKQLPQTSFRKIGENVFVAGPELCFLQMAQTLSFPKLVEFGYLLCGTYTLKEGAPRPNEREPLTTLRKLEAFLERMPGAQGRVLAGKALELVEEGSASPRETKLSMLLTFPVRLGGDKFPELEMNHEIRFTPQERAMFGRPFVVLDLYWPDQKVGIEYDGEKSHSESLALSRDRRKSSELQYRGINVIRVDKHQISSPEGVYVLSRKLARLLGVRLRKPTPEQWRKRRELYWEVMRGF